MLRNLGFRSKQILVITAVAMAVALATSLIHAMSLARAELEQTRDGTRLLARTLYHQARGVMSRLPTADIPAALAEDPVLRRYGDAVVGYSPTVLYLAIIDERGVAIFHSDPGKQGGSMGSGVALDEIAARNGPAQLAAIVASQDVLVADVPFSLDGQTPFGTVRVAVSSLLLRERFVGDLAASAAVASFIVLVVFLSSFLVANKLLAPIERLRRELARVDTGDEPRLDLLTEGDVTRVAAFFADVSRRLGQERRSDGDLSLASLVDDLAVSALVVDPENRIVAVNAPAARLVSGDAVPASDLSGRTFEDVAAPGATALLAVVEDARRAKDGIGPRKVEWETDGRTVGYSIEARAFPEGGDARSVLLTAHDLDGVSRLGSRLAYARKLEGLGGLASGVAHEVRNPLNGIAVRVSLMRDELPEAGRHLDAVEREVRRLDGVLDGFLQLARRDRVEMASFDATGLFERVIDQARGKIAATGVEFAVRVADDVPPAWGAVDLLEQAFLNLVLNACDAMPDGGRLLLTADRDSEGRIVLCVEDSGQGISPELLPRIFEPFRSGKAGGSGIGLAVVKRVVELHGGTIDVESRQGEGSRFTIRLAETSP